MSLLLLRRCDRGSGLAAGAAAPAALLTRLGARGLAVQPPTAPSKAGRAPGRPSGPATAATGSREGLGHWGGAKADYDQAFPQGPGAPAPDRVPPFGQPDPDEEKRARRDLHLSPHGYVPVKGPVKEGAGAPQAGSAREQ